VLASILLTGLITGHLTAEFTNPCPGVQATVPASDPIDRNPELPPGLFCVVLAAGMSTRFGDVKQLADYRGQPLVRHTMRLAGDLCANRSVLVAGNEWRKVTSACAPLAGFFVVNDAFRSGLGSSIAAGVAAVAACATGVLLLLADQPLIDADYLREMETVWRQNPRCIVASEYAGTTGPPVIFPARFFDELRALHDDRGARQIILDNASAVRRMPCAKAAVDIDFPTDLKSIL
jgi:molybdenum cofactor cytidylyltransferase